MSDTGQVGEAGEKEALERKLADLREAREAREQAREQAEEARRLSEEIAEEEKRAELDEAIRNAEEEHGPIGREIAVAHARYADGTLLGSVILRKPKPGQWKRFRDAALNDNVNEEAIAKLWRPSLVWPDAGTVDAYIRELPRFEVSLHDAVAWLGGKNAKEVGGK